ncbi:hypothetical protein SAMN02745148_01833 [Modicisalibacter ilicicola DSM 19980]|uniref:Uncharacterized protein n=1 Tax=Modicisalibacter ilicicola DSM 19980 TaxID=1121942 RepID=A0A1M4Z396_9GAMM|nr:hypothetical protein SAMN02745148_01833 [Halomonas ilicicola DSM 19980]
MGRYWLKQVMGADEPFCNRASATAADNKRGARAPRVLAARHQPSLFATLPSSWLE